MDFNPIHEQVDLLSSSYSGPGPDGERWRVRLAIDGDPFDVPVEASRTAITMAGSAESFVEHAVLKIARSLPNDGRKRAHLRERGTIMLDSRYVER